MEEFKIRYKGIDFIRRVHIIDRELYELSKSGYTAKYRTTAIISYYKDYNKLGYVQIITSQSEIGPILFPEERTFLDKAVKTINMKNDMEDTW